MKKRMQQPTNRSSSGRGQLWRNHILPSVVCLLFHLIVYAQPVSPTAASIAVPDHRHAATASGFPVFRLEAAANTPASLKRSLGETVVIGAAAGCIIGGVVGYVITPRDENNPMFSDDWGKMLNGLTGAAIGAGAGALAGFITWKLRQRSRSTLPAPTTSKRTFHN